jgi:hypothetical protein
LKKRILKKTAVYFHNQAFYLWINLIAITQLYLITSYSMLLKLIYWNGVLKHLQKERDRSTFMIRCEFQSLYLRTLCRSQHSFRSINQSLHTSDPIHPSVNQPLHPSIVAATRIETQILVGHLITRPISK